MKTIIFLLFATACGGVSISAPVDIGSAGCSSDPGSAGETGEPVKLNRPKKPEISHNKHEKK